MELKLYALKKCQQQKQVHRVKELIETKPTFNENEENKAGRNYVFEARNLKDIELHSNRSLSIPDSNSETSSETTS
jgi:hypothetical protein